MKSHVSLICVLAFALASSCSAVDTFSVTGTIVDADGNPVGGVRVFAVAGRSSPDCTAVKAAVISAEDGSFEFNDVRVQALNVPDSFPRLAFIAFQPDTWLGWISISLGQLQSTGKTEVVDKEHRVVVSKPSVAEGTVVDENGDPISGAVVEHAGFSPRTKDKSLGGYISLKTIEAVVKLNPATTDSNGAYRLTSVPEHTTVSVQVKKSGYAMEPRKYDAQPTLDFVIVPGGSLAGRLVNERGKAVSAVRVYAHSRGTANRAGGRGNTTTATDGSFHIGGLVPGNYSVQFNRPDRITLKRENVPVKVRKTTRLGKVITPSSVTVAGRVLDAKTGKPIEGAKIQPISPAFHGEDSITDSKGRYELRVLRGPVQIVYTGGNPFYLPVEYWRGPAKKVNVPRTGLKRHNIKLQKAEIAKGTVVDENGLPIAGARVSVERFGSTHALTDAGGTFKIGIPEDVPGGG